MDQFFSVFMKAFFGFVAVHVPAVLVGAVSAAGVFLWAVKTKLIPLNVVWNDKKIVAPEEVHKHFVTKELLMEHCDKRETRTDDKLERVLEGLETLRNKFDELKDTLTEKMSEYGERLVKLEERTSHHRKDDAPTITAVHDKVRPIKE